MTAAERRERRAAFEALPVDEQDAIRTRLRELLEAQRWTFGKTIAQPARMVGAAQFKNRRGPEQLRPQMLGPGYSARVVTDLDIDATENEILSSCPAL